MWNWAVTSLPKGARILASSNGYLAGERVGCGSAAATADTASAERTVAGTRPKKHRIIRKPSLFVDSIPEDSQPNDPRVATNILQK